MIYPNKEYQAKLAAGLLVKTEQPQAPPPSEQKLKLLLENAKNDEQYLLLVQDLITRHSLPYTVVNGELKTTLTAGELWLEKFITVNEGMLGMKEDARKMAKTNYEVLVTGETGTGKELIASSMIGERKGLRKALNCAGFPENLIESELFGHERGSFTGAETTKVGLMQSAFDGVLFLDEIGELPMHLQAKLLRSLQEKTIRKVGGLKDEQISCKFVCATHRDLREMVKQGTFRKDLYARISTLELDIIPLRERMDDVVPITESLDGGKKFLEAHQVGLLNGTLDLSLNVRSLQQHVIRYNILGRVTGK